MIKNKKITIIIWGAVIAFIIAILGICTVIYLNYYEADLTMECKEIREKRGYRGDFIRCANDEVICYRYEASNYSAPDTNQTNCFKR
jgi:hypothetical protein